MSAVDNGLAKKNTLKMKQLPSSHSHSTHVTKRGFGGSWTVMLVCLLRGLYLSALKRRSRSSSHIDFSWFDLQGLFERLQHLHQALLKL